MRHTPLCLDISQPLNNKSDTLSPLSAPPPAKWPGNVIPFSRHDRAPAGRRRRGGGGLGGTWLSLAWHRALLYKLSLGATLHSPQQPFLRSRLTYLQQYFLIQGWNGRAQIIVIMFSGYCRDDYVRYGAAMVPSRSVSSHNLPVSHYEMFSVSPGVKWLRWLSPSDW